ncbi:MAG: DNA primase [Paludibacteraceae bacterium]|nr:DNA primase [Paludibacteraceae bacterium]
MIDQSTIDRILAVAQIEEVVADYVSLTKRGANYMGLCPFHSEKTPSFVVSPSKGICKCFGCGKGGNAVNFIMQIEQLSYFEALRFLAKRYNITIEEKKLSAQEIAQRNERESMLAVNEFADQYFQSTLTSHEEGRAVGLSYFVERGFSEVTMKKFHLGFCPSDKKSFHEAALSKGFQKEYLLKTGLCYEKEQTQTLVDNFWGRVIFPIMSVSGQVLGFGARVLDSRTKGVQMKYKNSAESSLFVKRNELYGIYQAKQAIGKEDRVFLVEGYTDVISMHQAGIENVVASSGTSLTTGQISLMRRYTKNVTVLYDGDAAGIKASERGIDLLLQEGMNVQLVVMPNGEDPDSFAKKNNGNEFIDYLRENSVDFLVFKTKTLLAEAESDPVKKSEVVINILNTIAKISDEIKRSVYVKECSVLLGFQEKELRQRLSQIIEENERFRIQQEQAKLRQEEFRRQQNIENVEQQKQEKTEEPTPSESEKSTIQQQAQIQLNNQSDRDEIECNLLKQAMRWGAVEIFGGKENVDKRQNVTVAEWIYAQLNESGLRFQNEIYNTFLAVILEYVSKQENKIPFPSKLETEEEKKSFDEKQVVLERLMNCHSDQAIASLANSLSPEKNGLTKEQRKQYGHDVEHIREKIQRFVNDLKIYIVDQQIFEKTRKLSQKLSEAETRLTLQELNELLRIRRELAPFCGGKVINGKKVN